MLPQIKISQISSDRWKEYKKIRLISLQENPTAFGSSKEEEEVMSDEDWKKRLQDENNFKVFAEDGNTLIGKIEVHRGNVKKVFHTAEIFGVYVDPNYRKLGIGKMLLQEVEKAAKEKGIEKICLSVMETQGPAKAFYENSGFREIGVSKKAIKLDGNYFDEILMEKFI